MQEAGREWLGAVCHGPSSSSTRRSSSSAMQRPVLRRPYRLQAGFAFSTILVAEHPVLPFFVPSQPVRTKQTGAIMINGGNWPGGVHCRPNNPINILPKPTSACSRNSHFFRLPRGPLTLEPSVIYNTIILVSCLNYI